MRPSMLIATAAKLTKPGAKRDVLIVASTIEACAETVEWLVANGKAKSPKEVAKYFREKTVKALDSAKAVKS